MAPYRILYHHRIRADDGQAVHVRELIAALREAGHEVLECALVQKSGGGEAAASGARFWQGLSLPRRAVEVLEVGYNARGALMLANAARSFRPDFVYERHSLHLGAGLLAARAWRVPLLLEVNSPLVDEMDQDGLVGFKRTARFTERTVLSKADRVLAVTEVLRQLLIPLGAAPERTLVIGNGADPRRFDERVKRAGQERRRALGIPAEASVVGFIGYMRPWHRLDLLLEAMAQPDLSHLHALLIGEGPALTPTLDRAQSLGLSRRVHAIGKVPGKELPPLAAALDVALIPAINAYASPLKLFDSLAAGVATLAPDQPNLRENIQDRETGVLFRPSDAASLTDALRWLHADPTRPSRIGAAGRQALIDRDWTWAGNARRVVAAFEAARRA